MGRVGGWSWTVAFGRPTVAAGCKPTVGVNALPPVLNAMVGAPAGRALVVKAPPPVFSAMVGAPTGMLVVARRIVGAGAGLGEPGGRKGTVDEPVGGFGGPLATGGMGGFTGAAKGTVADGTAGGASAALSVTRTVSFFNGTLDVCFDGGVGWLSFSLIRLRVLRSSGGSKAS